MDVGDDGDDVIDLTSDWEEAPSSSPAAQAPTPVDGVEVVSPWAMKMQMVWNPNGLDHVNNVSQTPAAVVSYAAPT